MRSEIAEQVRRLIAESDHLVPGECPVEKRRREIDAERERKAREARAAEEKRQVAANDWYAAVDGRFNEHLQNWLWNAIDERIREHIEIARKPMVEATGDVLGQFRAQLRGEFKRAIEEQQRSFEAKLAEQKERHDGRIEASLARERDATGGAQTQLREEVRRAIKEMCGEFGAEIAALEQRLKACPGRLPVVKIWQPDSVTYEAQVVSYDGSLYQARKDTAQMPGGSDWVCVARAGRDGCDGRTLNFRGGFDGYREYQQFDVIEFDGSSFIAVRDLDAGTIPGEDGWQLLCRPGSRGPVGDVGLRGRKGERGARGADAPTIVSWTLDRKNYRAVPTMSNGQAGAPLDLRGLFEQYLLETSAATP